MQICKTAILINHGHSCDTIQFAARSEFAERIDQILQALYMAGTTLEIFMTQSDLLHVLSNCLSSNSAFCSILGCKAGLGNCSAWDCSPTLGRSAWGCMATYHICTCHATNPSLYDSSLLPTRVGSRFSTATVHSWLEAGLPT